MAQVNANVSSIVAHMPGVVAAVAAEGERRAGRVRAVAASRVRTGDFLGSIKTEQGDTDTVIYSDDPAALSINYGHQAPDGSRVEGVHAFEAGLT